MKPTPAKALSRATQLRYAAAGKCQQCGKRKPRTETMCGACAAKHAEVTLARKNRLIEAGLCVQCGACPPDTLRLCRACQDKHNARQAERRRERK